MGLRKYFASYSAPVIRSRRWQAVRQQVLRRDGFRCVQCGGVGDLEIDHVRPVRTHPEGSFDPSNLQTLCPSCHSRKTRIECGHPELSPERAAWRRLMRGSRVIT